MNRRFLRLVAFLSALFVGLSSGQPLFAQEANPITRAECTTSFPLCRVYLANQALGDTPTEAQVQVQVNGSVRENATFTLERVGAQVAFAFDEFVIPPGRNGYSVRSPGRSGQPMFVEFRQTAIDFFESVESNELQKQIWLAAFKTGEPVTGTTTISNFPAIVDWVSGDQLNAFYNALIDYEPDAAKNTPETPLYDLTEATLNSFGKADAPSHIAKHMLLFSDGFERIETLGLDRLILQAQGQGIRIHAIMLGAGDQDQQRTLQKLAEPTGGQFVQLTALTDLQPIWDQIWRELEQGVVSFPLEGAADTAVEITVGGLTAQKPLTLPAFKPPAIAVTNLPPNGVIERSANASDQPLADIAPQQWEIQLAITLPDGIGDLANRIESVEYAIGTITRVQREAPFETFSFPIETLDSGEYTLRVRVNDRFTGETVADPVSLRINVMRPTAVPPTATPLPEPTLTPVAGAANQQLAASPAADVSTSALVAVATNLVRQNPLPFTIAGGLLLLLFLLVGLRSRRRVGDEFAFTSDPPRDQDVTEPEDATEPDVDAFPVATLFLERGETTLPKEISLHRRQPNGALPSEWSIGRSYQECQHVLESRRVSRLHATILEQNGQFRIRDEGSAGGTYLTSQETRIRRRLEPLVPESLSHGDIINFNSVAYRFSVDDIGIVDTPTEPDMGAATEPEDFAEF